MKKLSLKCIYKFISQSWYFDNVLFSLENYRVDSQSLKSKYLTINVP